MPLPLTVSCFSKIQIGFTFLVPAYLGGPRQRAVKRVCVCVCCLLTYLLRGCVCGVWQLMSSELDEILHEQNRQDELCLQHYINDLLWHTQTTSTPRQPSSSLTWPPDHRRRESWRRTGGFEGETCPSVWLHAATSIPGCPSSFSSLTGPPRDHRLLRESWRRTGGFEGGNMELGPAFDSSADFEDCSTSASSSETRSLPVSFLIFFQPIPMTITQLSTISENQRTGGHLEVGTRQNLLADLEDCTQSCMLTVTRPQRLPRNVPFLG